jgi:serine/threonine-protein kinase
VLATNPTAGKSVPENSRVDLSYCAGPGSVQGGVPVVTGLQQDQATSQLKAVGLVPVVKQVDSTANAGIVVGVDPAEHSPVNVGQQVTIEVSKGNQAQLKDLTGMTQAQAESTLKGLGFTNIEVVPNTAADPTQNGLVTGQKPDAGKTYFKNTKITIFVGATPSTPPSSPPPSSPGG